MQRVMGRREVSICNNLSATHSGAEQFAKVGIFLFEIPEKVVDDLFENYWGKSL
jgi:hypothetical protein